MIISASRRTDIPAFYSEWFMNRIRAGHCLVPNPFNRNQVSTVSLLPADVDLIVFWTRNPRPLLPHLSELEDRGYQYYFLHTLMANPREIDPASPGPEAAVRAFRELSGRIGPERIIWRYDPIFLTGITGPDFHVKAYRSIAAELGGYTTRCIVSIANMYRKIQGRLKRLAESGVQVLPPDETAQSALMHSLAEIASGNGIQLQSCVSELHQYGIQQGNCIDARMLKVFGPAPEVGKDPCQRKLCGCVKSKDIGMYDSCLFGCVYCYATANFDRARANYRMHDPASPSLISCNIKQNG